MMFNASGSPSLQLRRILSDPVGLDLQVPCCLFRGELALRSRRSKCSLAVRSRDHGGKPPVLLSQVHGRALHPLESHFGQDEVIPLGVEAAFAASFVERFGAGTEEAVKAFMNEIRNVCRLAEAKNIAFWTAL